MPMDNKWFHRLKKSVSKDSKGKDFLTGKRSFMTLQIGTHQPDEINIYRDVNVISLWWKYEGERVTLFTLYFAIVAGIIAWVILFITKNWPATAFLKL